MQLLLQLDFITLNLMVIYAPNKDETVFNENLCQSTVNSTADYSIICGDFNLILNQEKDSLNYKHINNRKTQKCVF